MSKKVRVVSLEETQKMLARLAHSFYEGTSKVTDPTKIDLYIEKQKVRGDMCITLADALNINAFEIEITE